MTVGGVTDSGVRPLTAYFVLYFKPAARLHIHTIQGDCYCRVEPQTVVDVLNEAPCWKAAAMLVVKAPERNKNLTKLAVLVFMITWYLVPGTW